ncbi:hypothetical protein IFM89_034207 [Coptis chinensis]|uniref:Uncharacterized protein n=1 Tax=Coptis chinensis TaxID=261450 RepID=A0A835GZQ5_9MAGN|nr:hypothetical protein IFM89_034207 [Coptis chinensis]
MAYAGKKLALTELYGDVASSYNELVWYTKELKRRDPGNCVDLQVNDENGKFERVFVAFESSIHGFKYCRLMVYLDGTFLRS